MICTLIFVSLILSIKNHVDSREGILGAFSVGLTLFGMLCTCATITGGCLNPAVGLVQTMFQHNIYPKTKFMGDAEVKNQ